MKKDRTVACGELYDADMVIITPIVQIRETTGGLQSIGRKEKDYKNRSYATMHERHCSFTQVTIIGRNIQTRKNGAENKAHAPHIFEALTPTGLWFHTDTAEAIARACMPVSPKPDSQMVFEEQIEDISIRYDFQACIPFSPERLLFIEKTLISDSIHFNDRVEEIRNIAVSHGNRTFNSIYIKKRRCEMLAMVSHNHGLSSYDGRRSGFFPV